MHAGIFKRSEGDTREAPLLSALFSFVLQSPQVKLIFQVCKASQTPAYCLSEATVWYVHSPQPVFSVKSPLWFTVLFLFLGMLSSWQMWGWKRMLCTWVQKSWALWCLLDPCGDSFWRPVIWELSSVTIHYIFSSDSSLCEKRWEETNYSSGSEVWRYL